MSVAVILPNVRTVTAEAYNDMEYEGDGSCRDLSNFSYNN